MIVRLSEERSLSRGENRAGSRSLDVFISERSDAFFVEAGGSVSIRVVREEPRWALELRSR